jgi:ankyrin repeat protein
MKKEKISRWTVAFFLLACFSASRSWSDGGYFTTEESIALSADQRAIIIKNGDGISMTFSTGYTGEGEDFGWIIPTPIIPLIEDVVETGESGEAAFDLLNMLTAPLVTTRTGGCFPAGTEVLTAQGPRAIETISPGTEIHSYDVSSGEWVLSRMRKLHTHRYRGDMISIHLGGKKIRATGNHPFYVVEGKQLEFRPLPHDVPKQEQRMFERGRWVEARDLVEGDVLFDKSSGGLPVTGLSSREENTEVYNLEVEGFHNYALHRAGILVHNKMGAPEESESESLVTVYGTVTLEHYEVSVLGARAASALLEWLRKNEYHVDPAAREILDSYIDQGWAFVAAKLNPGERRGYENEFLPPLTIRYNDDQLVFPLRISSVSTSHTVKITLYVIADSTVASSNFPTQKLNYEKWLEEPVVPEIYIDACIQKTAGKEDRGMVVMWSGKFAPPDDEKHAVERLMKKPFPKKSPSFLTRLETRIDTKAMTEDVNLVLDPKPEEFFVDIQSDGRWTTGEDVEARDAHGVTELMYAVLDERDTDWVTSVLKSGTDVNARDTLDATALMYAARYNRNPETISTLLNAGAEINALNVYGWSALFYAARDPNPAVISTLMNAGADINLQDHNGWTPLMFAAHRGQADAVKVLLNAGADANVRENVYGTHYTALPLAIMGGHTEVVTTLLESGADVNAKGWNDSTPLMTAIDAYPRNHQVISMLLDAGADVEARDADGQTALLRAVARSWREPDPAIVSMLLEAGADVEAADTFGNTALVKAALEGHTAVVPILLQAGADVEARGKKYDWEDLQTPLMWAADGGHAEIVRLLLAAGADVNAKSAFGQTALMEAACGRNSEVVELLLHAGADVNARTKLGDTALVYARRVSTPRIIELLKKAGAKQ